MFYCILWMYTKRRLSSLVTVCDFLVLKIDFKILNQKTIFSTSAKIELSCDIKSLFRKSVDKNLKNFTSFFTLFFFTFIIIFIMILFHSAISFDHKTKIIKFRSLLIKLWSLRKIVYIIKNQTLIYFCSKSFLSLVANAF